METLQEVRDALKDRNITIVAKEIGFTRESIYHFMAGGDRPEYEMVRALVRYVRK